jgi:CheY-like chemotaxis protein
MAERFRLLLAEDDRVLREILQESLEWDGFAVAPARDGAEAFALFQSSGPYDLLLVDEEMPGLTGRQLVTRVRALGADVAVILISGNLELSDQERVDLRISAALRKPVSLEQLSLEIRRAIADVQGSRSKTISGGAV